MSETLFEQDTYAVVEVLGHNTFAGKISQHVLGGTAFIRVDVPEIPEETRPERVWGSGGYQMKDVTTPASPGFTKLIGAGSIYAITPCSEEVARKAAKQTRAKPVAIAAFEPQLSSKLIEASSDVDDDDDNEREDEDDWVTL